MKYFAHRGFSGKYPENTMLAFRKAVELGVDGIELDVHFSRDGELVICHDETVDRTTDGTGLIVEKTLAELKALDASATFVGVYGKQEIPTLREYFELVKDEPLTTNIEVKTDLIWYPGIEEAILKLIDEYGLREKVIISSFNHFSVLKFKELAPDMTYGFLHYSWIVDEAEYTAKYGVAGLHPLFSEVNEEYVKKAKAHNLKINSYTINEEADIRKAKDLGIDIAIGNFPDRAKAILAE